MKMLGTGVAALVVGGLFVLQIALWAQVHYDPLGDVAGWVGAIGTLLALVGGFAVVGYAEVERRNGLARAAAQILCEALILATDRLDVALHPRQKGRKLELRELRTTEMVATLRAVSPADLPLNTVALFAQARAGIYAVNERVSELYHLESGSSGRAKPQPVADRHNELESAVTVLLKARSAVEELIALPVAGKRDTPLPAVPAAIATYKKKPTPRPRKPKPRRSPRTAAP